MAKSDFHFSHRLRVRWSEVDRQGVVFFGNYLNYFDVAMTEYMRDLDYPYPQGLLAQGTDLHVIKAAVQYAGEVRFDDLLDIHTRIVRVGRSSLTFAFELYRKDEEDLLISGETVYVNVDVKKRKSAALPGDLVQLIGEREGQGALAARGEDGAPR